MLTDDQKRQRVIAPQEAHSKIQRNLDDFYRRFVIMDET